MDDNTSSIAVIVLGALILLASLTADMTGLGNHVSFGPRQIIGTVVGIIVFAMGIDFFKSSSTKRNSAE